MFNEEREGILSVIGEYLLDVQHVVSTAVPGLAAKLVIDIMVGVQSLGLPEKCFSAMATIGYEYCGEAGVLEGSIPGRASREATRYI